MAKKTHHLNFTSPLLGFANLRVVLLFEAPQCNFVRTGSDMSHKKFCTDYLKVGLRVNSNGPRMKPQLEFS